MVKPGVYEQRNDGHLLVGELAGGFSDRVAHIAQALSAAIQVRVTPNLRGAIWAKLLLNCSVTTIGAITAQPMRQYMMSVAGQEVFRRSYDEALSIALAGGARPERMIVEPIPPGWQERSIPGKDYDGWLEQIMAAYGDIKPSMLQDFERRRRTEIDFINGYVTQLGTHMSLPVAMNAAITDMVHRIEQGEIQPHPTRLDDLLRRVQYVER